jgi:paraquat-inducible protein B
MKAETLSATGASAQLAVTDLLNALSNNRLKLIEDHNADLSAAKHDLQDSEAWCEKLKTYGSDLKEFIASTLADMNKTVEDTIDGLLKREKDRQQEIAGRIRLMEGTANDLQPVQAGP